MSACVQTQFQIVFTGHSQRGSYEKRKIVEMQKKLNRASDSKRGKRKKTGSQEKSSERVHRSNTSSCVSHNMNVVVGICLPPVDIIIINQIPVRI